MITTIVFLSLALVIAVVPAILIDYEDVQDEYCVPENVSEHLMKAVEDCFTIGLADFAGLNPFSECKQHVFKERGIDDDEVRKILCSNEEEDEEFQECMEMVIMTHEVFKKQFDARVDCMQRILQ